jgi:hypothetical protein
MVWNDLKYFLMHTIKPKTKKELVLGIYNFWDDIVTVDYCNSKINHLQRVLKNVIALDGRATGL